ncbi:hypothetical protein JCM3765_003214 [Sporobolomyces pararoseus]
MSTSRSPLTMGDLREQSKEQLANIKADEYSIKTWISTAQVAFEKAARLWQDGSRTNRQDKVQEAFLEFKKAAGTTRNNLGGTGTAL